MSTTEKHGRVRFETSSFTTLHWAVVVLAAATGAIHVYLFFTEDWIPLLLAGLGFYGAIGLLIALPDYRKYLYPVGILFTLAQIVGYLALPLGPLWIGVLDKVIQVALITILGYLTYRAWGSDEPSSAGTPSAGSD